MEPVGLVMAWGWPILVAAATWFVLEFAAKPYLSFRGLRRTVQAQLVTLETTIFLALSESHLDRASMVQAYSLQIESIAKELRESGILLIAMSDTEWLLTKILSLLGYDLKLAGVSLLTVPLLANRRDADGFLSAIHDDKGVKLLTLLRGTLHLPDLRFFNA